MVNMDTSGFELKEKDVNRNLNIVGVALGDGSLVSPTYLLRLAKQSGIIQAQVSKDLSVIGAKDAEITALRKLLRRADNAMTSLDAESYQASKLYKDIKNYFFNSFNQKSMSGAGGKL